MAALLEHSRPLVFSGEKKSQSERDFLLSFTDLKSRADRGDTSAQFQVGLSLLCANKDCIYNWEEGKSWIIKAAQKNDGSQASICAQGVCHKLAFLSPIKNLEKAKECFMEGVKQSYIPSIHEMGVALYDESFRETHSEGQVSYHYASTTTTHVDHDKVAEAVKLLTQAVEAGYTLSTRHLGLCYEYGYGVAKDGQQAHRLYLIGSQGGYAACKRNLGVSYENGMGIAQSSSEARKWYKAAQAQGHNVDEDLSRVSCANCVIL